MSAALGNVLSAAGPVEIHVSRGRVGAMIAFVGIPLLLAPLAFTGIAIRAVRSGEAPLLEAIAACAVAAGVEALALFSIREMIRFFRVRGPLISADQTRITCFAAKGPVQVGWAYVRSITGERGVLRIEYRTERGAGTKAFVYPGVVRGGTVRAASALRRARPYQR